MVKQLRLYKKAKALLADSLTNIKTLYHAGFFNSKTASTILSYGMPAVESLDKIIASRLKIINNQQHNEIGWEHIKVCDVVLEGDVEYQYRILTNVDGKYWEYF